MNCCIIPYLNMGEDLKPVTLLISFLIELKGKENIYFEFSLNTRETTIFTLRSPPRPPWPPSPLCSERTRPKCGGQHPAHGPEKELGGILNIGRETNAVLCPATNNDFFHLHTYLTKSSNSSKNSFHTFDLTANF